ncbi:MAG: aconitase X [Synergistaceae bacterium]|jgi:predicted aconitase|nr:aconitase X [Synergistaceae bacterium]
MAFWIMVSADTAELAVCSGMKERLEKLGGRLAFDSCIDEPCWKSFEGGFGVTDSPKCAYYRERRGQPFVNEDIVEVGAEEIRVTERL